MTFLPIVERELRSASRKARSYWTRVLTGALGLLLFCVTLGFGRIGWRWSSAQMFQLLSWYAFVYCLFAGVLATADALSVEKRESTLGLLFLTDLHGYDIVLGKLAANSLGCLFGLLGTLPVLAIPLMLGGVQYSEFWRIALSLTNTLSLSLTAGFFVSVLSRNPFRATSAALLLMLLAGFGLPLLSEYFDHYLKWPGAAWFTAWISPFYAQTHASTTLSWFSTRAFWSSVLAVGLMSVMLVLLTCWTVTRAWRDVPESRGRFHLRSWVDKGRTWNFGRGKTRQALRERLLKSNPFAWLAGRERISSPGLLFLSTLSVCASGCLLWFLPQASNMEDQLVVWIWAAILLHIFLLAKVSSTACERLGSDRQSGALELLLCTPLSVGTILRGQWQALRRQLAGAVLIAWLIPWPRSVPRLGHVLS